MKRFCRIGLWPILLVVLGTLFLLENTGVVTNALTEWWPILLIIAGGLLIYQRLCAKEATQ